jgi:serine/threonine protein kinase
MADLTDHTQSTVFVDELFDELLDYPSSLREEMLVHRCDDPSLQDEVRALLRAADALPAPVVRDDTPKEGDRIAHYRLEKALGRGASGSVWTAFDTKLQSWTALKVFHGSWLRQGQTLDAVMREARAASQIISDHVVLIRNVGWDRARGWQYLEMLLCAEYVPNEDGEEHLVVGTTLHEADGLGFRESVRLVEEACRGADAAHRVGVLHRDIKPSNILVMPKSRRALVADFGLSTPQVRPSTNEVSGTETSVYLGEEGRLIVGTPCFMSPEQARGEPVTRTADVYSLGATLYAKLVGAPPYLSDVRERPSARDVLGWVRAAPPKPLREVAPEVPRRLASIVERAMNRDPSRRYPSAEAFADDLSAWRTHRPTSLDRRQPWLSVSLLARRHPAPVVTGAILGTMVIAAVYAVWMLSGMRQDLELDVAMLEDRRQEAEYLAKQSEASAVDATQRMTAAQALAVGAKARELAATTDAQAAREEVVRVLAWAEWETERAVEALEEARGAQRDLEAQLASRELSLIRAQSDLTGAADTSRQFEQQLALERLERAAAEERMIAAQLRHAEAEALIGELERRLITLEEPSTSPVE